MQASPHSAAPSPAAPANALRAVPAEVIVPLYMERPLIHRVHAAMVDFVHRHPHWRVRFVDDGSTDGTAHALETLLAINSESGRITLEALPTNGGKASAVSHGVMASGADHIFFMDGDLAYDPEVLTQLDHALRGADVAIGTRTQQDSRHACGPLRRTMGGAYNLLVRSALGLSHRDTQAGIKGFTRQAARTLFGALRTKGFGFDAELLFVAKRLGLRVREVPVRVHPDHAAAGSNVRLMRDPLRMLAGVARVRLNGAMRKYPS